MRVPWSSEPIKPVRDLEGTRRPKVLFVLPTDVRIEPDHSRDIKKPVGPDGLAVWPDCFGRFGAVDNGAVRSAPDS